MTELKNGIPFSNTSEIHVPDKMIDQVIGQEEAVNIIKKAAHQRRHVLLIGEPGTGKSMLGMGLAQLLPNSALTDLLALPNPNDENPPIIKEFPAGQGRTITRKAQLQSTQLFKNQNLIFIVIAIILNVVPFIMWRRGSISDIVYAASMIAGM